MVKYFTLLRYDEAIHKWMIELGSNTRSEVKSELEDLHDGYQEVPRKHLRIIVTAEDQASINRAVDEINEAEASKRRPL
jgi:hypothetical protein